MSVGDRVIVRPVWERKGMRPRPWGSGIVTAVDEHKVLVRLDASGVLRAVDRCDVLVREACS